jgi:hypothetical protein
MEQYPWSIAAAALLTLCGCGSPQPAVVVTTQTAPVQAVVAPGPPPKAEVEFIPPPGEPTAVWQPGHWRWVGVNGATWQGVPGSYVVPAPGYNHWVPGQWVLQAGGWSWVEGHWA